MNYYGLYYTGKGPKPTDIVDKIREIPGVTIINSDLPRSIALDISSDIAIEKLKKFENWTLHQSHKVKLDNPLDYLTTSNIPPLRVVK